MNKQLQTLIDFIQQNESISAEEKSMLAKEVKKVSSDLEIAEFKLERTEKVKRTTAILLEETIEELEHKRKAVEAQNRELEIEFSLERVRTVAMGIRQPGDLLSICEILYTELHNMGFGELRNAMINIHNDEKGSFLNYDFSESAGATATTILYNSHPATENLVKQVRTATDAFAEFVINGDELDQWREYRKSMGEQDDPKLNNVLQLSYYFFSIGTGAIGISTYEPVSEEKRNVLKRFRNVFELAYRRYLDVTLAEAQAQEAHIELALERVRARTMAMHQSNELAETALLLFQQLQQLGLSFARTGFYIWQNGVDLVEGWTSNGALDEILPPLILPFKEDQGHRSIYESHLKGEHSYNQVLGGEDLKQHYQWLISQPSAPKTLNKLNESEYVLLETQYKYAAIFKQGYLLLIAEKPEPGASGLLQRFAKVFEQTYTRFLDLQKAETQAREAQIEASLERVRARTMAMQKSDELAATAFLLFQQFQELGETPDQITIGIIREESGLIEFWITINGNQIDRNVVASVEEPNLMNKLFVAWKANEKSIVINLSGKQLNDFIAYRREISRHIDTPSPGQYSGNRRAVHSAFFSKGFITFSSTDPKPTETIRLLERFAGVFDQTYTRFLDLQKAEAQAREAIIEAALERVRSKTMAMHNSEEVGETVSTMLDELVKLGVETNRCGILIYSDRMTAEVWTAKSNPEGKASLTMGQLDLAVHPLLSGLYQAWKNKEPLYTYTMVGEDLIAYYRAINETKYYPTSFELNTLPSKEFHSDFYFAEGSIFAFTAEPIPPWATIIFKRFAGVFGQTYRRYLDLQKSEANAIEAIRRSSLDRVRAETASMRTTDDLERITPLIWNELTTLGVTFTRCGVFIMDQKLEQIHTFLSTPDGQAIAAFHLPYDTAQTTFQNLVEYWQKKRIYKEHWDEAAFLNWTRNLVNSGAISSTEKYVTGDHPTNLDLHFLPFLQGMLYVGNDTPLNEDDLHLVQNLADAFSTAYARYEDFNKLESAKAQIEKTLVDLKLAQAQLVQSEKMASLGELTAGIAHEIQNPLNFVNNFSEISSELIDEMKEELAAGNLQIAIEISDDVKQNLEKINHHGKRADAIVKGMLQHSRSSSGVKEPTNINTLADEFLRLAYHGLRAKDKSFNAKMVTDFDDTIGKINLIPQDIGRVILNLITNAFYAVNEKKKQLANDTSGLNGYEPAVLVSTSKTNHKVEVFVKDNGNGIPQNLLDKIFQPFFTTKPTGEGTGLGLSLSYDIVKAHDGELKVQTKEGHGSEFIISIPYSA